MLHLPTLIADLALILAAAAITTLLFKKIKQPVVLGYILAGLLVGPHFSFVPTVSDEESIKIWAEIGVIFLLFNLGLEFSFKKLMKVGGTSSVTAITEVVFMLLAGYFTGQLMGWSAMDSIFLGGILSISSTTIIIRAFEELGVKHKKFATLVFGVLIVEDLVAILLMVLLSTLAVSQQFSGSEMLNSALKLSFFLVVWFLGGIFLIPTFLKKMKGFMNDEMMLIISIALCLLMVLFATAAGFSPALGAFIMGSILAETTQAERIEHLTKSVKDLFAAVFFVSVGMLIDPQVLIEYAWPILVITLLTLFGKFISATMGAIASGQSLRHSIQAGMSLSQIGEFSFIIATLGLSLNVTSSFLYPIAVAVSAITTFTTPYLIKISEPFYLLIERILPDRWVKRLERYSSSTQEITALSDWKVLLRAYGLNMALYSLILTGIIFLSVQYAYPWLILNIENPDTARIVALAGTLMLMLPFIWALSLRRIERVAYAHLWLNKKLNRGALVGIEFLRIAMGMFFVAFLLSRFITTLAAIGISVACIGIVVLIFSRRLNAFYNRLESRFLMNLNERENNRLGAGLIPWDAHLSELRVQPESEFAGRTLAEIGMREQYGVNVALIERGHKVIATPGRDERLYPGDNLSVIGTDEQLANFKRHFESRADTDEDQLAFKKDLGLQKVTISRHSPLCGQTIRNSGIRENTQGLVVGVERNAERLLNPDSTMIFEEGDIVWIVGNTKRIRELFG